MRMGYYRLDENHNPVSCTLQEWGALYETMQDKRRVARYEVEGCTVSTVFLGLDHGWGEGPPILFETMVFGGALDREMERYSTWDEAIEGHDRMVRRVEEAM